MAADSKTMERNLDTHVICVVNSFQGEISGVLFLAKLLDSSTCLGIGGDASYLSWW